MLKLTCLECGEPAVGNRLDGDRPVWIVTDAGIGNLRLGRFHIGSARCLKHLRQYGGQLGTGRFEETEVSLDSAEASVREMCMKDARENLTQYVRVLGLEETLRLVQNSLVACAKLQEEIEQERLRQKAEEEEFSREFELERFFGSHPALAILRKWRDRLMELVARKPTETDLAEALRITDETFAQMHDAPLELIVTFMKKSGLLKAIAVFNLADSKELMKTYKRIQTVREG